jgi:hypothetical protein
MSHSKDAILVLTEGTASLELADSDVTEGVQVAAAKLEASDLARQSPRRRVRPILPCHYERTREGDDRREVPPPT